MGKLGPSVNSKSSCLASKIFIAAQLFHNIRVHVSRTTPVLDQPEVQLRYSYFLRHTLCSWETREAKPPSKLGWIESELIKAEVDLPPRVLARGFKISALLMGRERVSGFELTNPNLKSILGFVLTNPKPKKWGA